MEQPVIIRTANGANKRLVLHVRLRCSWLLITTPVSLLANKFDVESILHRSVQSTPADNTRKRVWQYIEKERKQVS